MHGSSVTISLFFFWGGSSVLNFRVISCRKGADYPRILWVTQATQLPDPTLTYTNISAWPERDTGASYTADQQSAQSLAISSF